MPKVGIVCDSTCDLGPEWLRSHDVLMVPLKINFGEKAYLDWVELQPERFFEMLHESSVLPKTSQPSPADFTAAYESLAAAGCDSIVSIHITGPLSGTVESALMAAATAPVPVRVVDTRTVSAGEALVVQAALVAREAGGDLEAIEDAARSTAGRTRVLFALDTLEFLVKGGRAGKAAGLAGSLLNIKPVLTVNADGVIEPFKKVKGMRKAILEMAETVAAAGRVRVAPLHSSASGLAEELIDALDAAGADYELATTIHVGAVIGTYAGSGAVGIAFYPLA